MSLTVSKLIVSAMPDRAVMTGVRAVELDRAPLPQLSLGAWQLKERGIEVAAVQLWREVKVASTLVV